MQLGEAPEDGGLFNYALEPLERRGGAIAANEQINLADLRQVFEEACEPDFADESRTSDQKNVLSAEGGADRKLDSTHARIEVNNWKLHFRRGLLRRLNRAIQNFRTVRREAQIPHQLFARDVSIRFASSNLGEPAPGPDHRFEQAACCAPIAKIEPVRNNALDAQVVRQRPHDVIEALAYEDHVLASRHRFL